MWRQLDDRAFFDFYARDAMLPVRVYPSVCHKPVLYRNDWIDPAVFSMDKISVDVIYSVALVHLRQLIFVIS